MWTKILCLVRGGGGTLQLLDDFDKRSKEEKAKAKNRALVISIAGLNFPI